MPSSPALGTAQGARSAVGRRRDCLGPLSPPRTRFRAVMACPDWNDVGPEQPAPASPSACGEAGRRCHWPLGRGAFPPQTAVYSPASQGPRSSIILALAPLVRAGLVDLDHGIVCDAKSGVSGAGKATTTKTHFMYAAENLSAYAVFGHRHTGEMLEQLGLTAEQIQFTPHLLPIPRGILAT